MPSPTLSEIRSEEWPNVEVTFDIDSEDDAQSYASMRWMSTSTKPTLAEMQAKRESAKVKIDARQRRAQQVQSILQGSEDDHLVRALRILAVGLRDLHTAIRANNTTFQNSQKPAMNGLDQLIARLEAILNAP